ncbi:hypothetical protein KBD81_00940 [Candidatus Woesebacteria bacterium]|nr:hypothetical protein [Candidatus Woesebacteria bacterium]
MVDTSQVETLQEYVESPPTAIVAPTEPNQFSGMATIQQRDFVSTHTNQAFFRPFDETEIEAIQQRQELITNGIILEMNGHPPASLEEFEARYSLQRDADSIYNASMQLVDRWIEERRFSESERLALTAIAQRVSTRLQNKLQNRYRVFLDNELSVVEGGEKQESGILGRKMLIETARESLKGHRKFMKQSLGEQEPITDQSIEEMVDTLARMGVDADIRADFIQGFRRKLEEAQTVQKQLIRQQEKDEIFHAEQADFCERGNNRKQLNFIQFSLAMKDVALFEEHPTPGVICERGGQYLPYYSVTVETSGGRDEVLRIYEPDLQDASPTGAQKRSAAQGWLWVGEISNEAREKLKQAGFERLINGNPEEETE